VSESVSESAAAAATTARGEVPPVILFFPSAQHLARSSFLFSQLLLNRDLLFSLHTVVFLESHTLCGCEIKLRRSTINCRTHLFLNLASYSFVIGLCSFRLNLLASLVFFAGRIELLCAVGKRSIYIPGPICQFRETERDSEYKGPVSCKFVRFVVFITLRGTRYQRFHPPSKLFHGQGAITSSNIASS
jgi:hypothetical protein